MAGYCSQCGTALAGHERFCASCGAATEPSPPGAPPVASTPWSAPGSYTQPVPPPPPSGTGAPYAPPNWSPPAASAPQPPTSRALATWLQVLLWISSAALVISAFVVVLVRLAAQDFYDAPAGADVDEAQRWIDREDLASTTVGLLSFVGIAVFVLLVIWAFQLTRAVNRHRPNGRRWSPGWAIGAWFIPLASYVLCPMILWEDEKIATAGAVEGPDRWRSVRPRPWVVVWFALWVVAVVPLTTGLSSLGRTDETNLPSRDSVMSGYVVYIVGALLAAAAAAVAALTIRHLTRLDHGDAVAKPGWEPAPTGPASTTWAEPRQTPW